MATGDEAVARLRSLIRDVPDFPRPGIIFKDITALLGDARAVRDAVTLMAAPYRDAGIEVVNARLNYFAEGMPKPVNYAMIRRLGSQAGPENT